MNYEKKDITIVLKVADVENKKLDEVKNKVVSFASEFNISLSMSQEIDEKIKNNDLTVEYYSKAKADEVIGDNYLRFLDKFLDIGYEDGVKTVPME